MTPERLIEAWRSLGEEPAHSAGMQRVRLDTETAADVFACIFWPSGRPGLLIEGNGTYRPADNCIPTCRGVRTVHEVIGAPVVNTVDFASFGPVGRSATDVRLRHFATVF